MIALTGTVGNLRSEVDPGVGGIAGRRKYVFFLELDETTIALSSSEATSLVYVYLETLVLAPDFSGRKVLVTGRVDEFLDGIEATNILIVDTGLHLRAGHGSVTAVLPLLLGMFVLQIFLIGFAAHFYAISPSLNYEKVFSVSLVISALLTSASVAWWGAILVVLGRAGAFSSWLDRHLRRNLEARRGTITNLKEFNTDADIGFCPNCTTALPTSTLVCTVCDADLGPGSEFKLLKLHRRK